MFINLLTGYFKKNFNHRCLSFPEQKYLLQKCAFNLFKATDPCLYHLKTLENP